MFSHAATAWLCDYCMVKPKTVCALDIETTTSACGVVLPVQLSMVATDWVNTSVLCNSLLNWQPVYGDGFNFYDLVQQSADWLLRSHGWTYNFDVSALATAPAATAVLDYFTATCASLAASGTWLVGVNLRSFDLSLLLSLQSQRYGHEVQLPSNLCLFDVGLLEKAVAADLPPFAGESFEQWQVRVSQIRASVPWSLSHCVDKYCEPRVGRRPHCSLSDCYDTLCVAYKLIKELPL